MEEAQGGVGARVQGCRGECKGGLDLDLEANLKAHRTPGVEHDGVPNNTAYGPAMPCEMHTPGPRRTLPSALGFGTVPRPRLPSSALSSTLRPHPGAHSVGAGPPRPCPLSSRSTQHRPLPQPLHAPAIAPATVPHATSPSAHCLYLSTASPLL